LTEALLLSALGAVTGALGAVVTAVRATRQGARSSCPEAVGVGIAAGAADRGRQPPCCAARSAAVADGGAATA
jgi:hypothetical protein